MRTRCTHVLRRFALKSTENRKLKTRGEAALEVVKESDDQDGNDADHDRRDGKLDQPS
jgi:hypothetical protein